jgi:ATP-dependent Zn protease
MVNSWLMNCLAERLACRVCLRLAGAVDDIRRATDIALRSVSEFGLSAAVGPLNVGVLAAGGADDGAWLMRDNGTMAQLVEAEVRRLNHRCWCACCFSALLLVHGWWACYHSGEFQLLYLT